MTPKQRIKKAISIAVKYGGIDGDHHKDWVIDQMVRALTDCPSVKKSATGSDGKRYTYVTQGESSEYKKIVADACAGEDGPCTHEWSIGVPP